MVLLTLRACAHKGLWALLLLTWSACAQADDAVYQTPEAFLAEVFGTTPPKTSVLWIPPALQSAATGILGHPPRQLRQRYWADGGRSVWILEEIGKEEPITAGFVVRDGKIELARVLIYRESRGMEVRHPAFLRQFLGAALGGEGRLDHRVDGISGATLSVTAMERMARLALLYSGQI